MMKSYRYIIAIIWTLAVMSWSACSSDESLLPAEGEEVPVTFRPTIDSSLNSRAIGEAAGIDQLIVAVYEGTNGLSKTFTITEDWTEVQRYGIDLRLIKGRSYQILFWAQDSRNTAYSLTDDGCVSVCYDDYLDGGFTKMEEMDAFFGTSSILPGTGMSAPKHVKLYRPLAQLNFADHASRPEEGIHQAVLKFHDIPSSFNPFTGEVTTTDADDVAFTFTDFPREETLSVDGSTYYYVTSNYLFAPTAGTTTVAATFEFQQAGSSTIRILEFKGDNTILLEKNKKTNVLGPIIEQPHTSEEGEDTSLSDTDMM